MICPRCGDSFAEKGATFREAQRILHQCMACEIWLVGHVHLEHLQTRLDALTRTTCTVEQACPHCAAKLSRFMLSGNDRQVDVEVCRTCALVVVDHDEVDAAETLLDFALQR